MKIFESNDKTAIFELYYAFARSPFAETLTACTPDGICFAGFVTDGGRAAALADLSRRFPAARLLESGDAAVDIFSQVESIHLVGTDFQRRVWHALLTVESGETLSYSQLAERAGVPRAVRAAASAVAANPLSIIVPCHRIIRNDGSIGKYFWGSKLKKRLLEAERK